MDNLAPELNERTIRASAIAHTINLGKCPPVGTLVSFSFQVVSLDTATFKTEEKTTKQTASFVVSQFDINNALDMIAREKAIQLAPKITSVPLGKIPSPLAPLIVGSHPTNIPIPGCLCADCEAARKARE